MPRPYDPQQATEESPESGERHQIIVKEFPDVRSGLLVEVFHYRENTNNCVRSASNTYIEEGYTKADDAAFLDGHTKDVFVDDPGNLYAGVYDTAEGFTVEVGEGDGRDDSTRTILFAHTYTYDDLGLNELDFD